MAARQRDPTRFIPELGTSTPAVVAASIAIATANAGLEEALWRGVYITLWPDNWLLGWLWPSIGVGLWHAAPQVIHPSSLSVLTYVIAAAALGLSWGWVAMRTRSLRWTLLSHIVTDASGLGNVSFFGVS